MNKFKVLNTRDFLIILVLALPYFLIYGAFFSGNPLAWGDAPYFYQENLQELFSKPLAWDFRNSNFGLSQFQFLWLYVPTFLMGLLNHLFGLQNDLLIRLVFYFPSTVLAFLGAWFFIRQFVKNRFGQILGSLLYSFNTYFLVLIDGGQIGVALAYSLFPLVLLGLQNFTSTPTVKKFFFTVVAFTVLSNIDIRIAVLSLSSLILLDVIQAFSLRQWSLVKGIFYLLPVIFVAFCLDAFWLLPLIRSIINGTGSFNESITGVDFLSLINGLFLFSPHFPKNEFGQISLVPFYFSLVPLLTFGGLLFKKDKKILYLSMTTLIFIFLLKGRNDPGGFFYSWFLDHVPFAVSFRDSSKFFTPVMIFSATLLGLTVEKVIGSMKNHTKWSVTFLIGIYIYLFVLIWPAVFGEMSGVLATSSSDQDYQLIYQNLKSDQPFFRTLWFPERPPLAFSSLGKEAISANILYKDPPFSSMIIGNYDLFYFLHDPNLTDWFKLLGIKYAFFPENERKKTWDLKEREERGIFLNFIDNLGFEKLNWGTSFPVYKVADSNPKIFGQDKIVLVLGGSDIYKDLKNKVNNFSLSNQGFIFLEDGISSPLDLLNFPNDSAILIFKDRDKVDLTMSFLQSSFMDGKNMISSKWGKFSKEEYLDAKYKLFKEGIESQDLMFGKELYFSTETGEKITFGENINESGKYRLAFRSVSASGSAGLKYKIGNTNGIAKNENRFAWKISDQLDFAKGTKQIEFENLGGFSAINVVAIISEKDYERAFSLADSFNKKFGQQNSLSAISSLKPIEVSYKEIDPTKYEINFPGKPPRWIVFSDHFDPGWQLGLSKPQPFYSMINGFLIQDSGNNLSLNYSPQSDVSLGIKISLVSFGVLIFIFLLATFHNLRYTQE